MRLKNQNVNEDGSLRLKNDMSEEPRKEKPKRRKGAKK